MKESTLDNLKYIGKIGLGIIITLVGSQIVSDAGYEPKHLEKKEKKYKNACIDTSSFDE